MEGILERILNRSEYCQLQKLDLSENGLFAASLNDFKILSSCSSASETLVKESIIISKLKPSLNASLSSVPPSLF